ncbi:P-loop containing nucleoside triphosphate hydrolase protein [Phaeosphaeriaceae sp. PMI808]|nr:P-loop containing nucleoside triphosphate hydrolase protein [Phaeosphaeriaceae sp. PMI808]
MSDAGKILAVLGSPGAGKATTIGNLIYKCGGIDMPTLERVEKGGNNGYAKAFNEIKARNETLYFYTPGNRVTVTGRHFPTKSAQGKTSNADGLLLIVTPRQTDKQLQEIGDQLISMGTHFAHKKVVVLINKMDEVDWSEAAYTDSVRATNAVLRGLGASEERILFVPASGLYSDNLIELSSSLGWYSKSTDGVKQGNVVTVVAALDQILT